MRRTLSRIRAWPGRVVRNTSVATRLALVVLLVALISLVITSAVGLFRGGELADEVLRARTSSLGAARADEVERYVGNLERAVVGQAISPSTATAIRDFSDAYRELNADDPPVADQRAVEEYYLDIVAPELSAARGRPVSAGGLIPRAPAAVRLQADFVVPDEEGDVLVTDAGDASRWSELHEEFHELYSEFVIQSGFDNLYLIEPDFGTIVYSTAKDTDFGTSLLTGPYSGSALAVLTRSLSGETEPGITAIRDFTQYGAVGDEPSLFVASPVIDDGSLAGYVALRIGPDRISAITTNDGSWPEAAERGETFVVARDNLMRSNARGFVEDRPAYLDAVAAAGTATESQIRSMRRFGTTVLFQPIVDNDVDAALDDEPGIEETTNYLGTPVLQARRALDIEGLEWAVMTEVDTAVIEEPIVDFARNLLIAIGLFLVAITFLAVRWSERLLRPLRTISAHLRTVRGEQGSEAGIVPITVPDDSAAEFAELADDIDTMLQTLAARNADAAARAAERRALLRQILPPQAAQRAEAGERDVVDQVAQATIAVVVIGGLGPLMRSRSTDDARDLLDQFVEDADDAARRNGLERIRLTGDAYYAACGTVRPHIDHAARAVAFALDVREALRDAGHDGRSITMTAGIDSGPVTVGLTGGSGLVYDAWGATVQRAADLARRSAPDEVRISAAVRAQLPTTFLTDDVDDETGSAVVRRRADDGAGVR